MFVTMVLVLKCKLSILIWNADSYGEEYFSGGYFTMSHYVAGFRGIRVYQDHIGQTSLCQKCMFGEFAFHQDIALPCWLHVDFTHSALLISFPTYLSVVQYK